MARIEKSVFLSYRRTNCGWATAVYMHLKNAGFDVFFDIRGLASGDFESIILQNIKARAHFLVLLTPTALARCSEPGDLLRREIEESMECRRNIVPLFFDGFSFNVPEIAAHLTGKLASLRNYNGVGVPVDYFDEAMARLCNKFLNVPLETVLHPVSGIAQAAARRQEIEASTDSLTRLLNRREFQILMERALTRVKAGDGFYAFCYIDIDDFKSINDKCGHMAGDKYLVEISALLKSRTRSQDMVARLGGDEFGILFEGSLDQAMRTAEELCALIRDFSFNWKGHTFNLGASIGVVEISADSEDVGSVLSAADSACYAAKKSGRNNVSGAKPEEDIGLEQRRRDMQWAARANTALEEGRFELFRQTIMPLQVSEGGKRYELLLRMRNEAGEHVLPSTFIPASDRYGLTPHIDRWVVENAFEWLASDDAEREKLLMCSINVSGLSLSDENFLPYVIEQLRRSRLDATKICFEITESAAVSELSSVSRFVQTVKDLGCKFAIDDVGTGLSSFAYMKHFPADFIKVDGSFVTDILRDDLDQELLRSINEIAHLTGKQTIAQLAESRELLNQLRTLGVDYAQGLSKPEHVDLRSRR
jgi:diguanylate cyclase (GGDEF)-like protein